VEHLSCGNSFDVHENEPVVETCFHMNDFIGRLVSTQARATLQVKFFP